MSNNKGEYPLTTQEGTEGFSRDDSNPQALKLDYDAYAWYLEDADLSEAEKRVFLDALWSIITNFVDLGFGVHPLQQVCEQNSLKSIFDSADVLESSNYLSNKEFAKVTDPSARTGGPKP